MSLWAGKWRSQNVLDGKREHILCERGFPTLFHTRREARAYINKEYGYIVTRKDLRTEPHGWRLPIAVQIKIKESK